MRSFPSVLAVVLATIALAAPALAEPTDPDARPKKKRAPIASNDAPPQHGNASFYSKHLTGRKTASGETYDPTALTAAHRTLPLGTQVKVTNPKNAQSVIVTVNDRGPVPKNRVIDVSSAAASELGMTKAGVTRVETRVVSKPASTTAGQ